MTNRNGRHEKALIDLSPEEMRRAHGGTDEAGNLTDPLDEEESTIATSGYIRVKKLNSGG